MGRAVDIDWNTPAVSRAMVLFCGTTRCKILQVAEEAGLPYTQDIPLMGTRSDTNTQLHEPLTL